MKICKDCKDYIEKTSRVGYCNLKEEKVERTDVCFDWTLSKIPIGGLKIRADELESKYNAIQFLSMLEQAGVLKTTWETHDGRMDKVWFYDS